MRGLINESVRFWMIGTGINSGPRACAPWRGAGTERVASDAVKWQKRFGGSLTLACAVLRASPLPTLPVKGRRPEDDYEVASRARIRQRRSQSLQWNR
jgi:hypothetical protein